MNVYITSGDINGISIEIILKNHALISTFNFHPIYIIDKYILKEACNLLNIDNKILDDMEFINVMNNINIIPKIATRESGLYSFKSFEMGVKLSLQDSKLLLTMPINKYAWNLAKINYTGHTHYLSSLFKCRAIMMLGNENLFVSLFTDHIPLKNVPSKIKKEDLKNFLLDFYNVYLKYKKDANKVLVLGLNPHAGDGGVIGNEENIILDSINEVNKTLGGNIFTNPISPDSAFIPKTRKSYKYYVGMYHDQVLAPLKALYFDSSINISLNIPILRTSPDHGSGYDLAYSKSKLNFESYLNAFRFLTQNHKIK